MNELQPEWLSGLIGVIAPIIVHWIVSANLTRRAKSFIAILVSCVIGFASAYLSGQFQTATVLKSIAAAFTISQLVYGQVFKDIFKKQKKNGEEIPFS